MDPGTDSVRGLSISSRPERGYVIAALSGERGIARAAALREKLPGLLRPAASRLVTGLSGVSRRQRPRRTDGYRVPRRAARRVLAPGRAGGCGREGPAHHRPAPAA